jgi:CBS domain-containing protein
MKKPFRIEETSRMVLWAETAQDLMMPNPISISAKAVVQEAIAFLIDKGFSAAPVIDEAGKPIGVLSRTDILVHDRERTPSRSKVPDYYARADLVEEHVPDGFQVENVDRTQVRDLMTPVVLSVSPWTPAGKVVTEMLALKVHRLFVVGEGGVLVGVISALDILKHLRPEEAGILAAT